MLSPPIEGRTRRRSLTWHVLIEPRGRPGAENMALDHALCEDAERTGRVFLRLYRFDPPCLSFGRNEPARACYDPALVARLGLDVVRRPTGGRTVWHEHELTYAVAAPLAAFGSLAAMYLAIHARLAAALRALGARATLAPDRRIARPPDRQGPCFATSVAGEVLIDGKKVIGSAQLRRGSAFLQHGSILLDGAQDMIRAVEGGRGRSRAVERCTTLSAALGRPVTFHEVAEAIVAAWGEVRASAALHRPPPTSTAWFSDPAWTWRR